MPSPPAPAVEAAQAPEVTTPATDSDSPLAATLTVPPLESEAGEGGEWQLLMDSAQGWVAQDGEPARLFTQAIVAAPSTVLMLVQPLTREPPAPS